MDVWDKLTPIQKSTYVDSDNTTFFNIDEFKLPEGKHTMIDLFSGAGGFSVGASWANFFPVIGIDHFRPAMDTWKANHPNSIGCLGDIKNIDPLEIKELLKKVGVDKINLITGGVPCQGFSLANRKRHSDDERNFLFLEYMKFVEVFNPDYLILENVSGMKSTAGGKFVDDITENIESLGYNVTVDLLNAADYGVPQVRKRLIFVGVKQGIGLKERYEFPEKTTEDKKNYRTVKDALSDLPSLGNKEGKERYETSPLTEYQEIMRGVGKIHDVEPEKLFNHVSPNHPVSTIEKIEGTKPGEPMYPRYKQRIRLSDDSPSPTQVAGGIRPQFQFGHPNQSRGLSIRERARIQSFPDSYIFHGGIVQERVQTGNAVPPLLIYKVTKLISEDIKKNNKGD